MIRSRCLFSPGLKPLVMGIRSKLGGEVNILRREQAQLLPVVNWMIQSTSVALSGERRPVFVGILCLNKRLSRCHYHIIKSNKRWNV